MANVLKANKIAQSAWPEATTATTAAADTTGANIIMLYVASFTASTATPTDSKSNTWTAAAAERNTGSPTTYERWWYCLNPTVGSGHTFSHVKSGGRPIIGMQAWSFSSVTSAFDQENGGSAAVSNTCVVGSLTNVDGSGLSIAGVVSAYGSPSSIDTSYTITDTIASGYGVTGAGMAYLNPSTGSAKNPTWTTGGAPAATILAGHTTWRQDGGGGGGVIIPYSPLRLQQAVKRAGYF